MQRNNRKISLTEHEINCLFRRLFGGPVPENEDLEAAALACVFYVGVEYVEETLTQCKEKK